LLLAIALVKIPFDNGIAPRLESISKLLDERRHAYAEVSPSFSGSAGFGAGANHSRPSAVERR